MVPVSCKPISISIAYEVVSRNARYFEYFLSVVVLGLLFKFRFFLHIIRSVSVQRSEQFARWAMCNG